MSKFEQYLLEKTLDLDEDVDYIYKKSKMDKFIEAIHNTDEAYIYSVLRKTSTEDGYEFYKFNSKDLTTEKSIEASKINPVEIRVGIFNHGSFYRPSQRSLQISLNITAFTLFKNQKFSKSTIETFLNNQSTRFFNEFSPASFKGSIYHELTHWLDDTLHNNFLTNKINTAQERGASTIGLGKFSDINHLNFEINSQIHAIKQLKRELSEEEFDNLNWKSLFQKKASIMANFRNFKTEKDYTKFIQNFVSRLHREDLLPKGMKKIPSWDDMVHLLNTI